ncbi:phage integrase N-terminal SAM-like domain-containing protein, partial [Desulfotruncus alcoholivorax]|uniref:phage integrase N-terminal SAM-like domain-containing protein n=1 Tax=Desulfotruncus alcoholivorax TaxID=265477 RepID=UPI00054D9CF2
MLEILVNQINEIRNCSKENFKEKLHELLSQYEIKKIATGQTHPDISEKMNMFLMAKRMEGLSEKTLRNYRKTIQSFGAYTEKPVNKIATEDIRNWLSSYPELKISTI